MDRRVVVEDERGGLMACGACGACGRRLEVWGL